MMQPSTKGNMTSSNFSFLQDHWPALLAEAVRAEQAALTDPRTACFYSRRTLELAVVWLFQAEGGRGGKLQMPYKPDLSAFLFEPSFKVLAYEPPFTGFAPQGPDALFTSAQVEELFGALAHVKATATVAQLDLRAAG